MPNKTSKASIGNTSMKDAKADMSMIRKGRSLNAKVGKADVAQFAKHKAVKSLVNQMILKPKSKEKA